MRTNVLLAAARCRTFQRKFTSSSTSGRSIKPSDLWTQYNVYLEKHPLLTKCITSGLLSITADIICQTCFSSFSSDDTTSRSSSEGVIGKNGVAVESKSRAIDWWRVGKFTLLGTFFTGPTLHYWYGLLARKIPGPGVTQALQRLALDQILFAPTYICGFYSLALLLDGTPELIMKKLKSDLKPTIIANFSVWVPCQFINFKFVPPHLQVLWSNMVGFFWNIYLSKLTYSTSTTTTSSSNGEDNGEGSIRA